MSAVRSHGFNLDGRVRGHGTRLFAFVIEKEPETRRHSGFTDGDFNKAVTEVDEEAIVRAAFDFPIVRRVPAPVHFLHAYRCSWLLSLLGNPGYAGCSDAVRVLADAARRA